MLPHTRSIAADFIQFHYDPLEDRHVIGEITFNSKPPHAGTLTVDGQLYRTHRSFGATFASGHIARNPGPVPRQFITVQVNGENVPYDYHHRHEMGRYIWGDRPIVEIEAPDGRFWHFQYRASEDGGEQWHQLIPYVGDVSQPYGPLMRHAKRLAFVWMMTCFVIAIANVGARLAYSLLESHIPSEKSATTIQADESPAAQGARSLL